MWRWTSARVPTGIRGLAASLALALVSACGDNANDPATAVSSTPAFSVTAAPTTIHISPGGSALSVVTIRGGKPPLFVAVGDLPNGVRVRVASSDVSNVFKLIITTDASVAPGTYTIGVRCMSSDGRPAAMTQVTLTVASP